MKIAIVTDAWHPQINGVVRTLDMTRQYLEALGHEVSLLTPAGFRTIPCPSYPEIRLAVLPGRPVARRLKAIAPDAVHIATEGPLGMAARSYCLSHGWPFTTSFHTRFPEYLEARIGVPARWTFSAIRWFHAPATKVLVATETLRGEMRENGIGHAALWSRGVDTELFRPRRDARLNLPGPILLYVGRVSTEKNLEAFLSLKRPGTKLVVGDGPERAELARKYPHAVFVGAKSGEELARYYASADAFVFPSRTDTFGLVLLEALASGLPVAAFPVAGPLDVLTDKDCAVMDEDLGKAVDQALNLLPSDCRRFALKHSWESTARRFAEWMAPIESQTGTRLKRTVPA